MKIKYFKASITIEAAFTIAVGIYVLLFLLDFAMFIHDGAVLDANIVRSGNKIQNHIECASDLKTGTIDDLRKDEDKVGERMRLKEDIRYGYAFSKFVNVDMDTDMSNIKIKGQIRYVGIVFPFKNLIIEREIKMAKITPAKDIRVNKEIHSIE